ncbi:hypothetical protein [Treponema sp.]|uniref:hypothetical protein n=1 Tax=Treponema sp. TaxID=166 RepID=UPI00260069E1|nr:hypothetical protein [Treponema sp.]MBR4323309.1 hypothetical protein [Treponema sp.]
MKKVRALFFTVIAVMLFSIGLSSCDLWADSEYTFIWKCNYANYIDVYPSNGGSPSHFRLSSSNTSVTVKWEGEGKDYYGGFTSISNYPFGKKAPWSSRYDSSKEVIFYDF